MNITEALLSRHNLFLELWDEQGPVYRVMLHVPPSKLTFDIPELVVADTFTVHRAILTVRMNGKYEEVMQVDLHLNRPSLTCGEHLRIDNFGLTL